MPDDQTHQSEPEEYPLNIRLEKINMWAGCAAAVLTFCAICAVASVLTPLLHRGNDVHLGIPVVPAALSLLIVGAMVLFWYYKRPNLLAFAVPFTAFVFISGVAALRAWLGEPESPADWQDAQCAGLISKLCEYVWLAALALWMMRQMFSRLVARKNAIGFRP